jgi:fluoride exporter
LDYKLLAAVFLGAGTGGVLRLFVQSVASKNWPNYPAGTLIANIVGCFAMGCLLAWLAREPNEYTRLGLGVGLLGGFTTFSAFSAESLQMIQRGQVAQFAGYCLLSVFGAIMAVWLGFVLFSTRS